MRFRLNRLRNETAVYAGKQLIQMEHSLTQKNLRHRTNITCYFGHQY